MKKKIFILAFIVISGVMSSYSKAELRCGGILVSCGVAAGCWDDEMTLEEYIELAEFVDAQACP